MVPGRDLSLLTIINYLERSCEDMHIDVSLVCNQYSEDVAKNMYIQEGMLNMSIISHLGNMLKVFIYLFLTKACLREKVPMYWG